MKAVPAYEVSITIPHSFHFICLDQDASSLTNVAPKRKQATCCG